MEWIIDYLTQRSTKGLLRKLRVIDTVKKGKVTIGKKEYFDFSSNDYLGLREHPALTKMGIKMSRDFGAGSCASRLMSGTLSIHEHLEKEIATFKGKERGLLYNSGYQANIGIISAMVEAKDVVFSDRFNHASIIDGVRLSGAKLYRYAHNNVHHLEDLLRKHRPHYRRSLIITESIFSMDGDRAPLKDIVELKQNHNSFLLVDEAHATGIFGNHGSGVCEEDNVSDAIEIIMGTFGKALGSFGAYIATSETIAHYLINSSRSFIYSTSLPPFVIGANLAALEMVLNEGKRRRETLLDNALFLRTEFEKMGLHTRGCSQIIPVIIGNNKEVIKISQYLFDHGMLVVPIRPPTVPPGSARLRFSLTFHHKRESLEMIRDLMKGY
ncbi:MAG: 8-amino-7-oxononanoate synthase [bacterium]